MTYIEPANQRSEGRATIKWLRSLAKSASNPQAAGAYAFAADEIEAGRGPGRL